VLRTLKFSRYLSDYAWRVTVLTLRPDAYSVTDEKLEAQIPDSVRVVRTGFLHTKRHLAIKGRYPAILAVPDPWIGWYPWAVSAGRKVCAEDPADVVFSTSPPATAHLIARTIARRAKAPHVIDFRDPWHEEPPEPGMPAVVNWFAPRLERKVVASAAHIVTSTSELREVMSARYPDWRAKITAIANGYDEADFATLPEVAPNGSGRLVVAHAGNINQEFRDPCPLFEAVARTAANGKLDISKVLFRFIGGGSYADSERIRRCIGETGLAGSVEFVPRIPYDEALRELAKADLLLLLQASEDTTSLVPAKLYEYLRAMRPVLALVLPGATTEVLAQTGGGWVANPRDPDELEKAMIGIFDDWQRGALRDRHARLEALQQFDRRRLTGKLAEIFDAVAGARGAHSAAAARRLPS
jgi:glycosyltransferase involved in cell wall biosynthesis